MHRTGTLTSPWGQKMALSSGLSSIDESGVAAVHTAASVVQRYPISSPPRSASGPYDHVDRGLR